MHSNVPSCLRSLVRTLVDVRRVWRFVWNFMFVPNFVFFYKNSFFHPWETSFLNVPWKQCNPLGEKNMFNQNKRKNVRGTLHNHGRKAHSRTKFERFCHVRLYSSYRNEYSSDACKTHVGLLFLNFLKTYTDVISVQNMQNVLDFNAYMDMKPVASVTLSANFKLSAIMGCKNAPQPFLDSYVIVEINQSRLNSLDFYSFI